MEALFKNSLTRRTQVRFSHCICALYIEPYLVVTANKFQRHLNKKDYFGREEFQLMVEQALADTMHHGRKVTLQKLAVVGLAFIIGLRSGSIGPSEKLYEEHEKVSPSLLLVVSFFRLTSPQFLKIRDVEVFQIKPMSWRVRIVIRHFKVNRVSISLIQA